MKNVVISLHHISLSTKRKPCWPWSQRFPTMFIHNLESRRHLTFSVMHIWMRHHSHVRLQQYVVPAALSVACLPAASMCVPACAPCPLNGRQLCWDFCGILIAQHLLSFHYLRECINVYVCLCGLESSVLDAHFSHAICVEKRQRHYLKVPHHRTHIHTWTAALVR